MATPSSSRRRELPPIEYLGGVNNLSKVTLRQPNGSSAEVYLHGAHVTSWKNNDQELLYVSRKATFKPPDPILGGIPICFPQFEALGSPEKHGFVRSRFWSLDTNSPPLPTDSPNQISVDLILTPSESDLKIWPHRFEFRLRVSLGREGELKLTSRIRNVNTNGKSFSFSFAYPTYFSVSDISEVRIEGLETLNRLDNLNNRVISTEQANAITFEEEIDKVYLSALSKIAVIDHKKKRTFVIRKGGIPDAAIWNPWTKNLIWNLFDKKAKGVAVFDNDEYAHMVCVGAAVVGNPVNLSPGTEWLGWQEISVAPSSYHSGELDPKKAVGAS